MKVDGSERTLLASGSEPDWQPTPTPQVFYPRPKGASPLSASLVVAYAPCADTNREHGPPLTFSSCSPPQQASDYLTVGTADSNGQATRYIGRVQLTVKPGNPATAQDEADVLVEVTQSDVRCAIAVGVCETPLADYPGELEGTTSLRLTDRAVGPTATQPGTMDRFAFPFTILCTPTADPAVGSGCNTTTTFNAIVPTVVRESKRAMWQLGHVEVRDGGGDGEAGTDDNTTFAVQGVFVP